MEKEAVVQRDNPCVVIIGAGMTGLLLVIKLREAGITNITLLEAKDRLGGTWRENTYPGVACDVPSQVYTYEFEPNPNWSNLFAQGHEIQAYFEKVFRKYGLSDAIHFNETVTSSVYADSKWTIKTHKNNTYKADFLFSATGILREPAKPEFPGMDTFKGAIFHTAEWDHSVQLAGKRIGYIGTGSTAAQAVPELVDMANTHVTVFQRTAQWILPIQDRVFSENHKNFLRDHPVIAQLLRSFSLWSLSQMTTAITGDRWIDKLKHAFLSWQARHHLNKKIKDPVLKAKLTPDYKFGCKRMVVNTTFYDAIQKPNAHLETSNIDRFVESGIVTKDGQIHELDVVVLSTGFNPAAFMRPMEFLGKDGLSINDVWAKKLQAYRSVFIPGFPNFFLMLGPNTPIGNFSVIAMNEVQCKYILQLIEKWQEGRLNTIEATHVAMRDWNARLKSNMGKTAWTSGCQSWYLDADGDPLSWPDSWKAWLKAMDTPDMKDFVQTDT